MDVIIPVVAGAAWGAGCGYLKYFLLWRPIFTGRRQLSLANIGTAEIVSMGVNVLCLLTVLWLRPYWPYSFEYTIVSAALVLSLVGRMPVLRAAIALHEAEDQPQSGPSQHPSKLSDNTDDRG